MRSGSLCRNASGKCAAHRLWCKGRILHYGTVRVSKKPLDFNCGECPLLCLVGKCSASGLSSNCFVQWKERLADQIFLLCILSLAPFVALYDMSCSGHCRPGHELKDEKKGKETYGNIEADKKIFDADYRIWNFTILWSRAL